MSVKSFFKGIFRSQAGKSVEAFAGNELDKAVVAAKTTVIGGAAAAAIKAVEDPKLTGEQKMLKAIIIVAPVVLSYVSKGGFGGVVADAEQFARSVIESTLADTRATKAGSIASVILAMLGIK